MFPIPPNQQTDPNHVYMVYLQDLVYRINIQSSKQPSTQTYNINELNHV